MPKISINDRTVHYREWGSGTQVIVILHGWPADSTHYQELGPALAKYGYRIIVPDFPGWGNTPAPEKSWSVSDYRDWVYEFVHALGLTQFHLFGHSFGGRVAIKYAIKYPYDVKKLLLCSSAGIKTDAFTFKRRILKSSATIGKAVFSLPLINRLENIAKKALYRAAGSNDYLNVDGVMKETMVKVVEEDLSPFLPQIHLKTLLLWGTEDGATPIKDAREMQSKIQDSELRTFEGVRHNLPKLIPAKLADAINTFLQ